MWEAERTGPDEQFTMTSALVALDEEVAVARVEVHYHQTGEDLARPVGHAFRRQWAVYGVRGVAHRTRPGIGSADGRIRRAPGEETNGDDSGVQRRPARDPGGAVRDVRARRRGRHARSRGGRVHAPVGRGHAPARADRGHAGRRDDRRRDLRRRRPAARHRRPGHQRGAAGGAHPDRAGRGRRGPAGQAGPGPAARADAAAVLLAARRARPEPQLGGHRLPRPELGRAVARAGAQDHRHGRGVGRERHAERRRVRGRLGRRRLGHRRRGRARGQVGAGPGDGRLPQRVRLQPARAARATPSCTTAAGWPPPRTGRSRSWPAPRWAAARWSTT